MSWKQAAETVWCVTRMLKGTKWDCPIDFCRFELCVAGFSQIFFMKQSAKWHIANTIQSSSKCIVHFVSLQMCSRRPWRDAARLIFCITASRPWASPPAVFDLTHAFVKIRYCWKVTNARPNTHRMNVGELLMVKYLAAADGIDNVKQHKGTFY